MILSKNLFHLFLGQGRDNLSRMIIGQDISEPLKVTVPAVDLHMQLWELNLERNVVSAQKVALVFMVAEDVDLD